MEDPRRGRRPHSPPPRCLGVYDITVDEGGLFHLRPNCGGPFRSFVEATAAIRRKHFPGSSGVVHVRTYGETVVFRGLPDPPRHMTYSLTIESGMFNIHPPDVGGPFESLSDALAAIGLHSQPPPRISPLPKEYFTIKDGLFHIHPSGLGGPFIRLDDALAALDKALKPPLIDWEEVAKEQGRRMHKWLDELDLEDFFKPVTAPQYPEPRKLPEEDTDWSIDDYSEPEISDPVVLKALQYVRRLEMEEDVVRDGLMWMENDCTQAFKAYLSSTETEGMEGMKYEFHKLDYQCLIYDGPKIYHHYNFTMNIKLRSKRHWEYKSFFAELKPTSNGKQYFCCPLLDTEEGHCLGCRNSCIKLRHPANGGYEEGDEGAGFPFDLNTGGNRKKKGKTVGGI